MENEQTYAPQPGEIKKVILVTYGSQGKDLIKTYEDLPEAIAAVYRLDQTTAEAIRLALEVASEATQTEGRK
jgi:hypothetical protein